MSCIFLQRIQDANHLIYFVAILWSGCFGTWVTFLTHFKINPATWTDCKLFYFLFYFGRHYSSMLLVLMSIEKCFAVYFPLKAKAVCTVKTAKWVTGIVGVILAGYDSINFYAMESDIYYYTGYHDCFFNTDNYHVILSAVDSVLYSSGPFSLIFAINLAIVFKFMAAKCRNTLTESTNQALAKAATRGTAMVVTVSVTFLLLTAPSAVHNATNKWDDLTQEFPLYRAFMNLSQYLNHSINGFLYCIVGSKFRDQIFKVICCRKMSESNLRRAVNNRNDENK